MTINNPLADSDDPLGEYPDLPPGSGVTAVLAAANHVAALQAFVNDLNTYLDGKHLVGATEIRNLMKSHHL